MQMTAYCAFHISGPEWLAVQSRGKPGCEVVGFIQAFPMSVGQLKLTIAIYESQQVAMPWLSPQLCPCVI